MVIPYETNRKVGENYLAAALLYQKRYGARSLVSHLANYKTPDALRKGIKAWVEQARPDCVYGPHNLYTLGCLPLGVPYISQGGDGGNFARIDEKVEIIGAAAVDLIIEQIQRNETGIPQDPKVIMIEGRWLAGSPSPNA